jgi:hypothetical protein
VAAGDGRAGGGGAQEGACRRGLAVGEGRGGWRGDRVRERARLRESNLTLDARHRDQRRHTHKLWARAATLENSMATRCRALCNTTTAPWGRAPCKRVRL